LALIREKRTVQIPVGKAVPLKFTDVSALIDPTSVYFKSDAHIIEQNFLYDLFNQKKLLQKYIGTDIRIKQEKDVIDGRLLSAQDGLIIEQQNQKIILSPKGQIELPPMKTGLILKPTLYWLLDNHISKPQAVELSYLTEGLQWEAKYIIKLDQDDAYGSLQAWVNIENNSGTSYKNTAVQLIAGKPHQVKKPQRSLYRAQNMMAEGLAKASPFQEESFFEYHLYDLQHNTTLNNFEEKQIVLLNADQVPFKKHYTIENSSFYSLGSKKKITVKTKLSFENNLKSNLGTPLPKGIIRIYKADSKNRLQFIGADQIKHTPRDETITIEIGDTFDITAEKILKQDQRINARQREKTYEITINNHKDKDVVVEVIENFWQSFKLLEVSHPHEQKSANTLHIKVPVKKDQEAILKYKILI